MPKCVFKDFLFHHTRPHVKTTHKNALFFRYYAHKSGGFLARNYISVRPHARNKKEFFCIYSCRHSAVKWCILANRENFPHNSGRIGSEIKQWLDLQACGRRVNFIMRAGATNARTVYIIQQAARWMAMRNIGLLFRNFSVCASSFSYIIYVYATSKWNKMSWNIAVKSTQWLCGIEEIACHSAADV
jgi:hypothetical protein